MRSISPSSGPSGGWSIRAPARRRAGPWTGPRYLKGRPHPQGYGFTYFNGRRLLVHRLAYAAAHGAVPAGAFVTHQCPGGGWSPCANPLHLKLGNHWTNMADMAVAGRSGLLRFPAAVVDVMRQMRAAGARYREIAARYETTPGVAQAVVSGSRRRHLPPTVQPSPPIRVPLTARISLPLAALLVESGCAAPATIAAGLGLDWSSLRYALSRLKGRMGVAIRLAGAAQIAALIDELGSPTPPLVAPSPGWFLPMLPLDQGLAARRPLRALMDLFRRLSPQLTRAEIAELRARYRDGEPLASLSERFQVCPAHASRVARGWQWSDLPGRVPRRDHLRGEQKSGARLSEADVLAIRRRYADGGITERELARRYGVGPTTIHNILTGRRWAHVKEAEANVA